MEGGRVIRNKKTFISNIIFWGSIWGIMEATLGYLLHWLPQLISGNIMFPIGAAILLLAYKVNSSRLTVMGVGLVATLIKAINLCMPNISMFKVLNPMISMLIQTLLFVIIVPLIIDKRSYYRSFFVIFASILWRGAYVLIMAIQYLDSGYIQTCLNTYEKALKFIVINGMLSGIFASALIAIVSYVSKRISSSYNYKISPLFSTAVMALAAVLTVIS